MKAIVDAPMVIHDLRHLKGRCDDVLVVVNKEAT
jgi:hypothetical protein